LKETLFVYDQIVEVINETSDRSNTRKYRRME
jgi:hypothetical protein